MLGFKFDKSYLIKSAQHVRFFTRILRNYSKSFLGISHFFLEFFLNSLVWQLGLDPFIMFLIFEFKFKFIDFAKTEFKFKFFDFAKVEFKLKIINKSWADLNSKIQVNSTVVAIWRLTK